MGRKAALDLGINLFDNAEMYGDGYAEEVMGRALRASGYKRSDYIIVTKVGVHLASLPKYWCSLSHQRELPFYSYFR